MNPAREKYYRNLFMIAAVYDVLLGIVFTGFPARAYDALGIREKLPAFGGYLSLLGAFVLVIGVAYFLISRGDLQRNRDLILVGALYKLAYSTTAFYYWLAGNIPHSIFVGLFGVADLVFFVLMVECYLLVRKAAQSGSDSAVGR
jgi:hypothetical protein